MVSISISPSVSENIFVTKVYKSVLGLHVCLNYRSVNG